MFYMLYTHRGQKEVRVMHTDGQVVVAHPGNEHLLVEMAQKLFDERIIGSYQLVKIVGLPVTE